MSPAITLSTPPPATASRVKRIVGRIHRHTDDAKPCSLPRVVCSHNNATQPAQETDLWNAAYDALKANLSTAGLVLAYESILIQQLPTARRHGVNGSCAGIPGGPHRLKLMTAVASAGLARELSSKSDTGDGLARNVLVEARETVASSLDRHPSAAIAWAGICSLTPLLLDSLLRHQDIAQGFLYLTANIPRFTSLPHILHRSAWQEERDYLRLREHTREALLVLYRRILECEMNCVCAAASTWNRAARNVVDWQGWQAMAEKMREADEELSQDIEQYATKEAAELLRQDAKAAQGSPSECETENSSDVDVGVVGSGDRD
ncbi:hypothetical protein G7Z17_g6368 [Cylindrodendrum hubeiense]|uniref:NWD NACHT-NTPase N-terminal domain-containing protein n=1 Tax=Cylindrodendrum hubeiense TaxID=595255 RepID=A0A9P5LGE7_9HYPO|nr:hypothetical protein G7Z17_g6368 [Cylindrodendrum hubeiense]